MRVKKECGWREPEGMRGNDAGRDISETWKLLTGRRIMILGHKRNKLAHETLGI